MRKNEAAGFVIDIPLKAEFTAGDGWGILIPEPAKYSREAAKLDLLIFEPGVQRAVGDRCRCFTAIERVCLADDDAIGRIALVGGLRAYGPRTLGPEWIARHHGLPVFEVLLKDRRTLPDACGRWGPWSERSNAKVHLQDVLTA